MMNTRGLPHQHARAQVMLCGVNRGYKMTFEGRVLIFQSCDKHNRNNLTFASFLASGTDGRYLLLPCYTYIKAEVAMAALAYSWHSIDAGVSCKRICKWYVY